MTARTAYLLLHPTARAMRWGPFAVATGLGLAVLAVPELLSNRLTVGVLTTLLRVAAACAALGVAFLLDDPATRTIPTVPTPRLLCHTVRAVIALPVAAAGWTAALTIATVGTKTAVASAVPRGALTVEAAALVAVALGLAAGGLRFAAEGSAGTFAAPALLLLVAGAWFIPPRVALILAPGDPHWTSAHHRWAGLLAVAVAGFVWASREAPPGTRRRSC